MGAGGTQWRGPRRLALPLVGHLQCHCSSTPKTFFLHRFRLIEWAVGNIQLHVLMVDWPSLSICSSSVAVAATKAHANGPPCLLQVPTPLKVSHLPLQWSLAVMVRRTHARKTLVLHLFLSGPPFLHLRWSFREHTISSIISCALSGPQDGGPGNLLSAYTWQ